MPRILPNGIGQVLGDGLVAGGQLYTSGKVWYVHAATGSDAASPSGLSPERPLATLGQAVTNSVNDDIIVLMDGHAETFSSQLVITKRLVIVGGGRSNGQPTVRLTNDQADSEMIRLNAAFCELRNVTITENAQACTTSRIRMGEIGGRFSGCRFECGANDVGSFGLLIRGAGNQIVEIDSCEFVSTATAANARPAAGLSVGSETSAVEYKLRHLVFDGGTVGWKTYAMEAGLAGQIKGEQISLLRGSDVSINTAFSLGTGFFQVTVASGGSRVDWV